MNDLTASLLCFSPQGDTHTLSLQVCIPLPGLSLLNKSFLCQLSHLLLRYVSKNKLCTCIFQLFASRINAFLLGAKIQGRGEISCYPIALTCLVVRSPGFHRGYPGSIPREEVKILFFATAHCCLTEIRRSKREKLKETLGQFQKLNNCTLKKRRDV